MSLRKACSIAALGLLVLAGIATRVLASAPAAPALVKTTPAQILVDGRGLTLYVYAPDKKGQSVCYGLCAKFWPPLTVAAGTDVPVKMPGLSGTFGVTLRKGGAHQLTFDGSPLYRFVEDKKPGDMTGQGLAVAGGYWWIVVIKPAAPATAPSYNSGYGAGW
jgi:predicted lipoprotein with Yx(FWY)xxD motif